MYALDYIIFLELCHQKAFVNIKYSSLKKKGYSFPLSLSYFSCKSNEVAKRTHKLLLEFGFFIICLWEVILTPRVMLGKIFMAQLRTSMSLNWKIYGKTVRMIEKSRGGISCDWCSGESDCFQCSSPNFRRWNTWWLRLNWWVLLQCNHDAFTFDSMVSRGSDKYQHPHLRCF